MERIAWTDQRLDDLVASLDMRFELLHEELRGLRADTREEFRALRGEFSALERQIAQIGWTLAAAVIAVLLTLVIGMV